MWKGRDLADALCQVGDVLRLVRAMWPAWFALSITLGPFWVVLTLVSVGFLCGGPGYGRRVVVRRPQSALE